MSKHIITLKNIKKKFGSHEVLCNFSHTFESGNIYVLEGESGSGKTTLLNIMSGLIKQDSGEISTTFGNSKSADWFQKKASYVFQDYALIDNDTVNENLKLATRFKKGNRSKVKFLEALSAVGLSDILDHKIYELSGGEQQRVSIARLYLRDFNVVFADEPTGNLDDKNTLVIMDLFKKLSEMNKIIIITSHNKKLQEIADEVITIDTI